jgi:hypothetical protein
MVERAGEAGRFDMKIHPHMLRHACGFKLANDGVGGDARSLWDVGSVSEALQSDQGFIASIPAITRCLLDSGKMLFAEE